MADVCLIIIFNHKYDKNLPKLEEIYRERFSDIYYLVPFYDGDMENVIPVYGRSIFFETYIAQGANIFFNPKYKHYLFIADDMILRPSINEDNYKDYFEVEEGQSWIPALTPLQDMPKYWIGTMSAFTYRLKQKYVEAENELLSEDEAISKMKYQGLNICPLNRYDLFKEWSFRTHYLADKFRLAARIITKVCRPFKKSYKLNYPLVGSYSDIVLVAQDDIKRFAHYCGVFGSTSLFVEVAIPTSLVLSAQKKIKTEKDTKYKGRAYWQSPDVPFWEDSESHWDTIEQRYKNLDDMFNRFPDNQLYIHPVKLSKWAAK